MSLFLQLAILVVLILAVFVCVGNKRFMKPTIILWLIEIALGTYVHVLLYVPLYHSLG